MHSKSYISFIRIGQEGFFPPAAAQMFLLDRDSQDFCPLSLALHFAAIKENPVSADRHSGIKKDQELENYCELRADLCATAEQCALVCVVFFFLIVRSRKQKSPPEEKKNACQANSQDESDLTLFFFFFFETKRYLGLSPSNRDSVSSGPAVHICFRMPGLHNFKIEWHLWYLVTQSKV